MYLLCETCKDCGSPSANQSFDDDDLNIRQIHLAYQRMPSFIQARKQWILEIHRRGVEVQHHGNIEVVSADLVCWLENHYLHGEITLRNDQSIIMQTFTPDVHLLTESSITKLTIMRDELTALINQLKGTV